VACAIAEGSVLEVAGSLYIATSNSAIGTAGISTALQYIQAIGSATGCVFAYDAVAPTWRDDYQGYYASAASATRVIGGIKYTGSYTEKWIYKKPQDMNHVRASGSLRPMPSKTIEIGDWDMNAIGVASIAHGLTMTQIRKLSVLIRFDSDTAYYPLDLGTDPPSGRFYTNGANIDCVSTDAGSFDNASFDLTSFNRGWITIQYEDGI
jgi:hypothetical protein